MPHFAFFASKTASTPAGVMLVTNAIKTSVATVAAPVTYITSGINGSIGLGTMALPRVITATLAAQAASYVAGSVITVTGTDASDAVQTDTMTIVGTDGTESLYTTKFFKTVVSITIAAQADTLGAFVFGVQDAFVPGGSVMLRVGVAGTLHLKYGDGSIDILTAVAIGECVPVMCNYIYADSTAQNITAYLR